MQKPLSPYSTRNRICVGHQMQENRKQTAWNLRAQCDANAKTANAPYIPLACIGAHVGHYSLALGITASLWALQPRFGHYRARVESARLFGYQHIGIGNTKISRWRPIPTGAPNANPLLFGGI